MNEVAHELIGRTLGGRFRLTAFLGEGAMASVFRGEQDGEPREVAVKIMHRELLRDATFAKRFAREAKAASRIEHKNSVRILEHGADGELLYLAMEPLGGHDLFEVLARSRDRRLPQARAARIVAQICGALTAAHAHGIVHRDLKPENVMILADPDQPDADLVKVLDFGIAKILDRDQRGDEAPASQPVESMPPSSMLTMVGGLVGTPEYMSPEQTRGIPVDARSDVYACGVLLFVIVTGKPPFTGSHPVDIMMQHVEKDPPAPSALLPGIHPALEQVILKALAKMPSQRQQSAAELGAALEAILGDLEGAPSTQALPTQKYVARVEPAEEAPAAGALDGNPPSTQRSPPQTAKAEPPKPAASDGALFERTLIVPESLGASDKKPAPAVVTMEAASRPPAAPAVVAGAKPAGGFDRTLVLDEALPEPPRAAAQPVVVVASKAPATASGAFDKTLVLDEMAGAVAAAPAADFEKTLVIEEQAGTSGAPPHAPAAVAPKPTATVAPEPARAPLAVPARSPLPAPVRAAAPVPGGAPDPWVAPWWMFVLGMTAICVALWLVRYLRFGFD